MRGIRLSPSCPGAPLCPLGLSPSPCAPRLQCACQHNTCGSACERCCRGFNRRPWEPATPDSANECQGERPHAPHAHTQCSGAHTHVGTPVAPTRVHACTRRAHAAAPAGSHLGARGRRPGGPQPGGATGHPLTARRLPFPAACHCHGHADDCYYDPAADRHGASQGPGGASRGGSVCIDCKVGPLGLGGAAGAMQ